MPLGAVLLVRLKYLPAFHRLQDWRDRLMHDFSLDREDFYANGPFVVVKGQNEGPIPTQAVSDPRDCWIEVNLWRAYYGPGYERGDLELFIACAEWLEANLVGCEVWYGNDCTDESLELFDLTARYKFKTYYDLVGCEPYKTRDQERKAELRALWPE